MLSIITIQLEKDVIVFLSFTQAAVIIDPQVNRYTG